MMINILLLVILVLLNGILSASEIAFISIEKFELDKMVRKRKKNAKKIALPYDFFTFLFPFAPNKKYYMARWSSDSILVFDDEQKILNSDDCQVLVANHDLVFTGVYDYKKGVVKIKDQAFFDNIKIDKWDFWAVYKYKIKSDILKLSDLKR